MSLIYSPQMLQYLDMLLKHGNYTKAAKTLYISQPYLTQTIKKVEQELGIEIINRQATPLQLTEAGTIYYQYLRSLETNQDQLKKKLAKYTRSDRTIIRIGILPSLGTYLLPLFLTTYLRQHPQVTFDLVEDIPSNNERRLQTGEIDFLIGQNPENLPASLTTHAAGNHGYYAVIPQSSALFQPGKLHLPAGSLEIKDLLSEELVLTTRGSAIRRQLDYLFQKYHIQPRVLLESTDIFTVVALAKSALGVTFVPESVTISVEEPNFNLYPMPLETLSLAYFIAYAGTKTLLPTESELVEAFLTTMKKHGETRQE